MWQMKCILWIRYWILWDTNRFPSRIVRTFLSRTQPKKMHKHLKSKSFQKSLWIEWREKHSFWHSVLMIFQYVTLSLRNHNSSITNLRKIVFANTGHRFASNRWPVFRIQFFLWLLNLAGVDQAITKASEFILSMKFCHSIRSPQSHSDRSESFFYSDFLIAIFCRNNSLMASWILMSAMQ